MGLGKTLSVITFLACIFASPEVTSITTSEMDISDLPVSVDIPDVKEATDNREAFGGNSAVASSSTTDGGTMTTAAVATASKGSSMPTVFRDRRMIFRVLIVCPVNVLQNWVLEFEKWTKKSFDSCMHVYILESTATSSTLGTNVPSSYHKTSRKSVDKTSTATQKHRLNIVSQWFISGGICVMGYDMLRQLVGENSSAVPTTGSFTSLAETDINKTSATSSTNNGAKNVSAHMKKVQDRFRYCLINPGADLIVADEAHIIKNPKTKISKIFDAMKSTVRIALTGSPLQNNLLEYWCMVNWVKPLYLGNYASLLFLTFIVD
jgi:SNF2 family DNA or RNA helicase